MKNIMKKLTVVFAVFAMVLSVLCVSPAEKVQAKKKASGKLSSVKVIEEKVLRVKYKAKKLAAKKVKISVRRYKDGKSNKRVKVESVQKVGKHTFDLFLKTNNEHDVNYISTGNIVKVKIGKDSKEVVYRSNYKPEISVITGRVGNEIDTNIYFDGYVRGYCKFKVSKLPKGLKAVSNGSSVRIVGKPKTVVKGKKVTVKATDEYGKKAKATAYLYVGSDAQMVTYTNKQYLTVLKGDDRTEYYEIRIAGGSGDYNYKMTNKVTGVSVDEDGEICISDKVAVGKHTVKYSVTDKVKKKTVSGSFKFNVKKAVKVTGVVKAKDKKGMDGANVVFSLNDTGRTYHNDSYYGSKPYSSKTAGAYTAYVAPGGTYRAYAYKDGEYDRVYNFKVAKKAKKQNFSLDLYKISLKASDGSSLKNISWDDEDGVYVGYGNKVYFAKGKHTIYGRSGMKSYKAVFTVKKNATVTVKVTSSLAGSIKEGVAATISATQGAGKYYTFTPSKTGTYNVRSGKASIHSHLTLYTSDSLSDELFYEDCIDSDEYVDRNVTLTAGQTYYFYLVPNSGTCTTTLNVSYNADYDDEW